MDTNYEVVREWFMNNLAVVQARSDYYQRVKDFLDIYATTREYDLMDTMNQNIYIN